VQSALDLGVRFIEVDVHIAANGVPVTVRHNDIPYAGSTVNVADLTAAELGQVDASERARFGARYRGIGIPRLVDILSLVTKRPEATVFVTLARASLVRFGADQVVAQVAEALRPFRSRCIVVSADLPAVLRARSMASCQIGWEIPAYDGHTRLKFEALQPEYIFCDRVLLPPAGALWRGPWRWVIRGATSLEAALDLAARGADFVATGNVGALGEAMRTHATAQARAQEGTPIRDDASTVVRDDTPLPR